MRYVIKKKETVPRMSKKMSMMEGRGGTMRWEKLRRGEIQISPSSLRREDERKGGKCGKVGGVGQDEKSGRRVRKEGTGKGVKRESILCEAKMTRTIWKMDKTKRDGE